MGYYQSGITDITGIDINLQKRYPFRFILGDALRYLENHGNEYDVIHSSPPCQAYSHTHKINDNPHPKYINQVRELLLSLKKPFIIENVEGSELINPLLLCGTMFGLRTYRHRLFETSFSIEQLSHPEHLFRQAKMGRKPKDDEYIQVIGHFSGVSFAKQAMGIDWMVRNELAQAIPPSYTKYIGEHVLTVI